MGTWALPQTKQQAERLSKLLEKPLLLRGIENKLYDLIGDDVLFDRFYIAKKEYGCKYDYRKEIKDFVQNIIEQYKITPQNFKDPFEPKALKILEACLK